MLESTPSVIQYAMKLPWSYTSAAAGSRPAGGLRSSAARAATPPASAAHPARCASAKRSAPAALLATIALSVPSVRKGAVSSETRAMAARSSAAMSRAAGAAGSLANLHTVAGVLKVHARALKKRPIIVTES